MNVNPTRVVLAPVVPTSLVVIPVNVQQGEQEIRIAQQDVWLLGYHQAEVHARITHAAGMLCAKMLPMAAVMPVSAKRVTLGILSSLVTTLMNALPAPCITVAQVLSAPTVCQDMSANVLPVTRAMVALDVWPLRSELDVTLTLIVLITPSVERTGRVDVDQDLKQMALFVLMLMSVLSNQGFAAKMQRVQTVLEVLNAGVHLH